MDWHIVPRMAIPLRDKASPIHRAIVTEAKKQGATAYALAKSTGLAVYSVQRFLDGTGNPTLSTVEAVAKALGLRIDVRKESAP